VGTAAASESVQYQFLRKDVPMLRALAVVTALMRWSVMAALIA
jgi:hypothetical protein